MQSSSYVKLTRDYYDSLAHEIYKETWGGENHHLGLFDDSGGFFVAAQKSNANLLAKLYFKKGDRIIDLGSGFGGLPRYLAYHTGCHVTGLNLSKKENEYARQKNKQAGLDHLIDTVEGDFNDIPFNNAIFDIAVSQDAMLHSPDKVKLLAECSRIVKKGGQFVFSDILQLPGLTQEEAEKVNSRINVPYLASFDFYKEQLPKNNLEIQEIQNLGSTNVAKSYQAVHDNLRQKKDHLVSKGLPADKIEQTLQALLFWVEKAGEGKLGWGLFVCKRI